MRRHDCGIKRVSRKKTRTLTLSGVDVDGWHGGIWASVQVCRPSTVQSMIVGGA